MVARHSIAGHQSQSVTFEYSCTTQCIYAKASVHVMVRQNCTYYNIIITLAHPAYFIHRDI